MNDAVNAYVAVNRFGLGAQPGEARMAASDPRGWVLQQIHPDAAMAPSLNRFRSSDAVLTDIHTSRAKGADALRKQTRNSVQRDFARELLARATHQATTPTSFAERMVLFWSNHFTVSTSKAIIAPAVAAYEREAIRPHVFGRFADMLKAVVRHPVMLAYLDNVGSMGENSRIGKRRMRNGRSTRTLNENLAREILELHTVGVVGGYDQDDVINLARAISGWSFGGIAAGRDPSSVHGRFAFVDGFHEPGAKTVLGKTYREDGPEQGLAILDDLARHPSTAVHIAAKLVRHFVQDDPPADAVRTIAMVMLDSDGDLATVSRALVGLEAAWRDRLSKAKSHQDYVISVLRLTGMTQLERADLALPLQELGQMPFSAPSPAGWGDRAKDWVGPGTLMRRLEWSRGFAARLALTDDPGHLVDAALGPLVSETTRNWIDRAPSPDAAVAMLFASPEFQRR